MAFNDGREWRTQASVSTEKWTTHAKRKLEKGYRLVISNTRKNANFYLPGKGYEMCDYKTARRLVDLGLVVEVGEHHLGTLYDLVPDHEVMEQLILIRREDEEAKQAEEVLEDIWVDADKDIDADE